MDECDLPRVMMEYSELSEVYAAGFGVGVTVVLAALPVRFVVDFVRSLL